MKTVVLRIIALAAVILMIVTGAVACDNVGDGGADTTEPLTDTTTSADVSDTEAPTLSVDAVAESVLDKTLTVTGSVSDNDSVESVSVGRNERR